MTSHTVFPFCSQNDKTSSACRCLLKYLAGPSTSSSDVYEVFAYNSITPPSLNFQLKEEAVLGDIPIIKGRERNLTRFSQNDLYLGLSPKASEIIFPLT